MCYYVKTMSNVIPEDIEIYFKCDGSTDVAFKAVSMVVPGVTYEAHKSKHDGFLRYYLTFPAGEFDSIQFLGPVLRHVEVVNTGVYDIDEYGFDARIGFTGDATTSTELDEVATLTRRIGSLFPAVLYTSDTPQDGPLAVDARNR